MPQASQEMRQVETPASPSEDFARRMYEEDVSKRPFYHDGTPRKRWEELDSLARRSWGRLAK